MARPVVANPFENQIPTVSATASPVDIYVRPADKTSPFAALADTLSRLEQKAVPVLQREEQRRAERELKEGQRLYEENRFAIGDAVKKGIIEEGASPYIRKGYRISQMSTLAMRYAEDLERVLEQQKLYTNGDPARIEAFVADFQKHSLTQMDCLVSHQQRCKNTLALLPIKPMKSFEAHGVISMSLGRNRLHRKPSKTKSQWRQWH